MSEKPFMPYFPRGKGPLVSVLLPTRDRIKGLCTALDSLHSLAKVKEVEYILKIDDDDKETLEVYNNLKSVIPIKALISSQGNGYKDYHLWINEMCKMAKGDWLYMFNDDATMTCNNWDVYLYAMDFVPEATWHGCPDVCMLITPTKERPESYEMAFLRKNVVDILGHYSLNPHCDNWMATVMCFISSAFRLEPVVVTHPEKGERQKQVPIYKETGDLLNTPGQRREMVKDVLKLIDHVEKWQAEKKVKEKEVRIYEENEMYCSQCMQVTTHQRVDKALECGSCGWIQTGWAPEWNC